MLQDVRVHVLQWGTSLDDKASETCLCIRIQTALPILEQVQFHPWHCLGPTMGISNYEEQNENADVGHIFRHQGCSEAPQPWHMLIDV
jgi:hypothetical protein